MRGSPTACLRSWWLPQRARTPTPRAGASAKPRPSTLPRRRWSDSSGSATSAWCGVAARSRRDAQAVGQRSIPTPVPISRHSSKCCAASTLDRRQASPQTGGVLPLSEMRTLLAYVLAGITAHRRGHCGGRPAARTGPSATSHAPASKSRPSRRVTPRKAGAKHTTAQRKSARRAGPHAAEPNRDHSGTCDPSLDQLDSRPVQPDLSDPTPAGVNHISPDEVPPNGLGIDWEPARRLPPGQISVLIGLEALRGQTDEMGLTDAGTELPPDVVRGLSCDAEIIPMILGGPGGSADVGRARRTVPLRLRRLLIARDRHCRWPGCHEPPSRWRRAPRRALGRRWPHQPGKPGAAVPPAPPPPAPARLPDDPPTKWHLGADTGGRARSGSPTRRRTTPSPLGLRKGGRASSQFLTRNRPYFEQPSSRGRAQVALVALGRKSKVPGGGVAVAPPWLPLFPNLVTDPDHDRCLLA